MTATVAKSTGGAPVQVTSVYADTRWADPRHAVRRQVGVGATGTVMLGVETKLYLRPPMAQVWSLVIPVGAVLVPQADVPIVIGWRCRSWPRRPAVWAAHPRRVPRRQDGRQHVSDDDFSGTLP